MGARASKSIVNNGIADISNDMARSLVYCRKGYTHIAHLQTLQIAISKERLQKSNNNLKRRGLIFALDYYLA